MKIYLLIIILIASRSLNAFEDLHYDYIPISNFQDSQYFNINNINDFDIVSEIYLKIDQDTIFLGIQKEFLEYFVYSLERAEKNESFSFSWFIPFFWLGITNTYLENYNEAIFIKSHLIEILEQMNFQELKYLQSHLYNDINRIMKTSYKDQENHKNENLIQSIFKNKDMTIRFIKNKECRHNNDGPADTMDIIEHIGNQEFGSAFRDVWESLAIREYVREIFETIGRGVEKDFD